MSFSVSTQPLTIDPAAGRSAQEMSLSVLNGVDPSIYTELIMSSGLFQGVRRRMIWNSRVNFGSEVIGSSGLSYAA